MAERNPFYAPQIATPEREQIWNHPHPSAHLHLGNAALARPMNGSSEYPAVPRPVDCPTPGFPTYMAGNSVPVHNMYTNASSTAGSSLTPADRFMYLPPPTFNHHESNMVDPQAEIRRASFKRKAPVMPTAFNGQNPSGYYSGGSSSNLHIAPNPLHTKPVAGPLYWPSHSANIPPGYRSDNLFVEGESSQRNIRSRHYPSVNVEMNRAVGHSSSNLPGYFPPPGNPSGFSIAGQVNHAPMAIAPRGRILSSDPTFNHERNQSLVGPVPNFINATVENTTHHPNFALIRNTGPALTTTRGPSARGPQVAYGGHSQRSNVHRFSSAFPTVGFSTDLESAEPSRVESASSSFSSSRYLRPSSIMGRGSYRSGRTRNSHSRFQSIYDVDNSRSRWHPESAVLMERSGFYGSRNLYDQHGDMRLDVDNMTYEELLALGERIGNVSTGLSEEKISECLQVTTHCSPDQESEDADEGEHCVICLEEFKDEEKVGRLRCKHDFHVSCIKNWLSIKNACPICKSVGLG